MEPPYLHFLQRITSLALFPEHETGGSGAENPEVGDSGNKTCGHSICFYTSRSQNKNIVHVRQEARNT